ncbi:cytochrome P450 [Mycolicibacterium litorale]|uniref:Cytochrome P450 n=1 Tax=Mycolicibacterium litorale TaxID=758802 RepID=A0AAD1MV24_9MYCO|nr:cytochrome P450 [Mycolicibacterium litorale]MCV7415804.1 cytochrome P450 [Mycolicibacterium litorale]TDY09055.1 cytochrome P450 [Mycolicibacterium litorale]BBY16992.1 cytochrome P450 [Mycolicibacterium litorale]
MVATNEDAGLTALPLPPKNPLPYRQLLPLVRNFHTGQEVLRQAAGPVIRLKLGPKWMIPQIVVVTSPAGIRDILGRNHAVAERCRVHDEVRDLGGESLFVMLNDPWVPRRRALQPVFTKPSVRGFGGHMSRAAEMVADRWGAADDRVDLDEECRRLTMRSLGRSILGLDLDARADVIAGPLPVAASYAADRALKPIRAPRWFPSPQRRRANAAVATMKAVTLDILQACRADPSRDAPLVHALIGATDPETGLALSDDDICNELLVFMLAGHDTTATLLTYALWALGHHPEAQDRVAAEASALGDRRITPEDIGRLNYTVQVLNESLRLCPPAAGVGRLALRDVEIDGYRVEAGTLVGVGIYAVHRDPALWDRPLEFDPDRFSPENSRDRDRWQFVPFAGGPRACIGQHFAMLEATLALATLIRSHRIDSIDDEFPLETPYTTVAAGPIWARVRRRV